jgi:hypothetical protein
MNPMRYTSLAWPVAGVAVAAAALGYWLFGLRGVVLWVPLGTSATLLLRLLGRRAPGLAIAVPLLIAAAALFDASTLGWGGADAPDGTRYKASPVGLSHVLSPHQPVSPTVDCRWHLTSGDADLCAMAPGAEGEYRQLRAVFPLVSLAITVSLVGAVAQCRHAWRRRFPHRVAACAVAVLSALALWLFSRSLGPAVAVLADLDVGTGGTLGTMEVTAAILLCLSAAAVSRTEPSYNTWHARRGLMRKFNTSAARVFVGVAIGTLATLPLLAAVQEQKPAPPAETKAPPIAGKWTMSLELEVFTATPTLVIRQDGEKITGTYIGRYGEFPFEGTLKGRALAFAFKMNAEGTEIQMSFTGDVAADGRTMKGRVTISELGDGSWSAKRAETL